MHLIQVTSSRKIEVDRTLTTNSISIDDSKVYLQQSNEQMLTGNNGLALRIQHNRLRGIDDHSWPLNFIAYIKGVQLEDWSVKSFTPLTFSVLEVDAVYFVSFR